MKNSHSYFNNNLRDIFDWRIMKLYRYILGTKFNVEDFMGPFVPHVFDEYWKSKKKILIVVQQTAGLIRFQEAVNRRLLFDQLTLITKEVLIGGNFIDTPHWDFALKLNTALNKDNHRKIAWTNLIKVLKINGLPGDQRSFDHLILPAMPLLYDELSILQPDIILFLTGSEFDEYIKLSISVDAKLEFHKIQNYELNEFAGFEINGIPCYRLMRPSCMAENNRFDKYLSDLINLIQ